MIGFVKHKSTWYTQPKKLYQHLPTFLPCPNVCWGLRQFAVLVLFVCKSHLHLVAIARLYKNRDVGDGWAGWSISHPDFCKSDNLISTIEGSAPNSNYVYLPTQLSVASYTPDSAVGSRRQMDKIYGSLLRDDISRSCILLPSNSRKPIFHNFQVHLSFFLSVSILKRE